MYYARTMGDNITSDSTKKQSVKRITMPVENPFLIRLKQESIRAFLRRYDAYCKEVKSRIYQLAQESSVSLEPSRPVVIYFCVDADHVESAVECDMNPSCTSVEELTDKSLRSFLDSEGQETQPSVTGNDLPKLVETVLKMDMTVKSATGQMKLFFME